MSEIEALSKNDAGLRLLLMINDISQIAAESGTRQVPSQAIIERGQVWGLKFSGFSESMYELEQRNWISFEASLAGIDEVLVREAGIDAAAEFRRRQSDPMTRFRHLADDVLKWLYEVHLANVTPRELSEYLSDSRASYMALPFTNEELLNAWKRLKGEGFTKSVEGLAGAGVIIHPAITAEGAKRVEHNRSVFEQPTHMGGSITHINAQGAHGFTMAVNSPHAVQSNTLTGVQLDQVKQTVDALRGVLTSFGMPEGVKAESEVLLGEIETEMASGAPQRGKIKERLSAVGAAVGKAGVQIATTAATALVQHAVQGI